MQRVTPLDVLDFWIADAREDPQEAQQRNRLWFGKSPEADQQIAEQFVDTIAALASGLAWEWAERGPRARLAAIIALDQFSRNVFRDTPGAFEKDELALQLARVGVENRQDRWLSEVERIFFYMPFEHSETLADQILCVELFERLANEARAGFVDLVASTLDYAERHKQVIAQFARFPHRNAILGRISTPQEEAYLAKPGAGF